MANLLRCHCQGGMLHSRREDTLGEMYKAFRWSLEACFAGVHPAVDHQGVPYKPGSARGKLAGKALHPEGYFLAVFQVLGDLDELCNSLGLKHFNSNTPCFWCDCNVDDVPWSDFGPRAAWRRTLLQDKPVMAPPSELDIWKIPGVSELSVGWDCLHGLDLGPCLHVAGNVLEDLLELRGLGRNADERMARIWAKCQDLYRELAISNRLPHLDISSFRRPSDYPRLRAKGNEAKHFAKVLKGLLKEFDPSTSPYARQRQQVVHSLVRLYEILDHPDLFLTSALAKEGNQVISEFLKAYTWLANDALQAGRLRWQVTIKFHFLAHAALLLPWSNLRFSSTYPGEAFVGRVARIAFSASLGKPAFSLGGLLMQKLQASRAIRMRMALA